MAALAAAGFRAVRCDLPGYGDSPYPDELFDTAELVVGVLDDLGIETAAVVGSSGGGLVALEIAARWPQRVSSLALLCTAAPGMSPSPALHELWEREEALLEAGDVAAATDLNVATWVGPRAGSEARALVRQMQRHAFEVQLAAPPNAAKASPQWDLATITAPALLVSGAHDLPDFAAIAAALTSVLPAARHVSLDWAGHLPNLEDPAPVNELLLDLLRRE